MLEIIFIKISNIPVWIMPWKPPSKNVVAFYTLLVLIAKRNKSRAVLNTDAEYIFSKLSASHVKYIVQPDF